MKEVLQQTQVKAQKQVQVEQIEQAMQPLVDFLEFLKQADPARVRMIEGKRDFLKQIILLSAWIIAFAIPILDKWNLIQYKGLYRISLTLFILLIIVGVFHFHWTNQLEEKTYKNTMIIMQKIFQKQQDVRDQKDIIDIFPMLWSLFDLGNDAQCIECRERRTTNFLVWGFIAWLALLVLSLL